MATPVATFESVAAAIDQIRARAEEPTVDRVRAITGGSNNTILKHLRILRGEAQATQVAPAAEVPAELPAAIARSLASVGASVAAALAEARAEERRGADAALLALRSEADRDRQTAAAALTAAQADAEGLAAQADDLQAALDAAQTAQATAEARATAAEAEALAQQQQVGRLLDQLASAKAESARGTDVRALVRAYLALVGALAGDDLLAHASVADAAERRAALDCIEWAEGASRAAECRGWLDAAEAEMVAQSSPLPTEGEPAAGRDEAWRERERERKRDFRRRQKDADEAATPSADAVPAEPTRIKGGLRIEGRDYTLNIDSVLRDGERTEIYVRRQKAADSPAKGGTAGVQYEWVVGRSKSGEAPTTYPSRDEAIIAAATLDRAAAS